MMTKTDPRLRTPEELAEIGARVEASRNWQSGNAGHCNIVNYDGDDITGVAMIPSAKNKDVFLGIVGDIPALLDHAAAQQEKLTEVIGQRDFAREEATKVAGLTCDRNEYRTRSKRLTSKLAAQEERIQELGREVNAAEAENIRLLELFALVPHSLLCPAITLQNPTPPWGTFMKPTCKSMFDCGSCEKCDWLRVNPPAYGKCNCIKSKVTI